MIQTVLEEKIEHQKELICRDFDLDCLNVNSPTRCAIGGEVVINEKCYYFLPIKGICPMIKF